MCTQPIVEVYDRFCLHPNSSQLGAFDSYSREQVFTPLYFQGRKKEVLTPLGRLRAMIMRSLRSKDFLFKTKAALHFYNRLFLDNQFS